MQRKILLLLKSCNNAWACRCCWISHDLNLVRSIAQRVCVMRGGEIVEQASRLGKPCSPHRSTLYSCELLNAEPEGEALPRT